jgi:hypothetical protein
MQQIWLRPNMAGTMGNATRNVKGVPWAFLERGERIANAGGAAVNA